MFNCWNLAGLYTRIDSFVLKHWQIGGKVYDGSIIMFELWYLTMSDLCFFENDMEIV